MAMEATRPAQQADSPTCAALLTAALAHTTTMRGGVALVGSTTSDQLLERWTGSNSGDSGRATLHVGEFHDVVVGLAAATISVRPGSAELTGRIECCYVEEGARGVGVGTALMDAMVAWCTEKGCRDMDALALPGDRTSKQRLEAAGFTARLLILNRPLS
jgi:GNAT superfamily N-acetyltransferase